MLGQQVVARGLLLFDSPPSSPYLLAGPVQHTTISNVLMYGLQSLMINVTIASITSGYGDIPVGFLPLAPTADSVGLVVS